MGIFVATICCALECSVAPECGNRLVDVQEKIYGPLRERNKNVGVGYRERLECKKKKG